VSIEDLKKYSNRAHRRSDHRKKAQAAHNQTDKHEYLSYYTCGHIVNIMNYILIV